MKNLGKGLLLVAVLAFALTSCNKEKAAVKKFEGTWTLDDVTTMYTPDYTAPDCGGTTVDITSSTTVTFEAYTVGEAESGNVYMETVTTFSGTTTTTRDTSEYSVAEDGSEVTFTSTNGSTTDSEVYIIESLSKTEATLTEKNSSTVTLATDCAGATSDFEMTNTWKLSK